MCEISMLFYWNSVIVINDFPVFTQLAFKPWLVKTGVSCYSAFFCSIIYGLVLFLLCPRKEIIRILIILETFTDILMCNFDKKVKFYILSNFPLALFHNNLLNEESEKLTKKYRNTTKKSKAKNIDSTSN